MGIDPMIFAVLGPIHLFMQFWYHTRLIGNLGFLEHIIVTPSHHRVHHAINPEYLDRNFGQILIVWDKMFGTFQRELETSEPVYGILRPAKTWNPILINFKHSYQLCKDAWRAESFYDKLRIWFMPTGWRPDDVTARYPIKHIEDPRHQVKYDTNHSNVFIIWSWFQFGVALLMMLHMFTVVHNYPGTLGYMYVGLIFLHIFAFTSILDGRKYGVFAELVKVAVAIYILFSQNFIWYGLNIGLSYFICTYLALSLSLTIKKIK
jgi:hypothetical protein